MAVVVQHITVWGNAGLEDAHLVYQSSSVNQRLSLIRNYGKNYIAQNQY